MATVANNDNLYGVAKLIVDNPGYGNYTTLGSAMAAAVSGDTIFLKKSVTENVTLTPGVNIVSFTGNELTPNVSITGKLSMTGAGTCTISGIRLTTNSDFFLAVTGSAASIVNLENCYLNCSNNTGISHTSSSSSSAINITNCNGDVGTTGITLFVSTSSGQMKFKKTLINNSGSTTTASSTSTAAIGHEQCHYFIPFSTSSTGSMGFVFCQIGLTAQNATAFTTAGTGSSDLQYSNLGSGTASCISIGAGTIVQCLNCEFTSSNTNVITGAGTLYHSGLTFGNSSSIVINPTTSTASYTNLGKYKATGQPCFLATNVTADTNAWGDGGTYDVIPDTEIFDQNSNYDTGTGVFTAPVTGIYAFHSTVSLGNTGGTAAAKGQLFLVATSRTLESDATALITTNPNTFITLKGSWLVDMTAGDTAKLQITGVTTAATKTGTIYGSAGTSYTWFSGHQIA